ncbi:damage-inducible protein DinB [Candidatus Nomurabacteria bacterium]|nr:damage-inducible protein DinB [Candidatus Nomurabacteria bacterium]
MDKNIIAKEFLRILDADVVATRKCLERITEKFYGYKPHDKSMIMGSLAQVVAEIPKWIAVTIEKGEVNFATWEKYNLTTTADLIKFFSENVKMAEKALKNTTDEELEKMFYLKSGDKELMKSSRRDSVAQSLMHWAHHRGQLTVYMRLNGIPVPAIYGPSADEKEF